VGSEGASSQPGCPVIDERVYELLRVSPSGAIVLERIARGGGATRWFACRNRAQLQSVVAELLPGSCVSFYFDDRISCRPFTSQVNEEILRIIRETGDAVVGQAGLDGVHLDMEIIAGPIELREYTDILGSRSKLYFGAFPARDNDGRRAVTLVLPDADGVIRTHPH
jgi:hypothetical protein